jgi:hypothetical protein
MELNFDILSLPSLVTSTFAMQSMLLKNSLIIHEENTKKNHKRVVSVYVIQIHVDLHKL